MNRKRSQHLLWTWCESVVPDHVPRDLCSVIALCVSRIADSVRPGGRRAGRERNIDPTPQVTHPFHPSSAAIL